VVRILDFLEDGNQGVDPHLPPKLDDAARFFFESRDRALVGKTNEG